jgi:hypothetical protein
MNYPRKVDTTFGDACPDTRRGEAVECGSLLERGRKLPERRRDPWRCRATVRIPWDSHLESGAEAVVEEATRLTHAVARIDDPYALSGNGDRAPLPMGTFVNARIGQLGMFLTQREVEHGQ